MLQYLCPQLNTTSEQLAILIGSIGTLNLSNNKDSASCFDCGHSYWGACFILTGYIK
jgi:hypothetical protein